MKSKYRRLREDFSRWLRENGGQALVAVSPGNVLHTSGAYIVSQRIIRDRLAMTIFPVAGGPTLIVGDMVERTASADSWIPDVRSYQEFRTSPMQRLAKILREKGLARSRIALEIQYLPVASYMELCDELPDATFFDAGDVLNQTRAVKSVDEIDLMRRYALATEKAIEYGFRFWSPGDTERHMVTRMRYALNVLMGAEWNPFVILGAGSENTAEHHHVPEDKPILRGEIVFGEIVGFWRGYYSGYGRMAVVGEATRAQSDAYQKVLDVQRHVMELARPGVRACDLYRAGAAYSTEIGMPFDKKFIGHSIGLALHESPILEPSCETPLEASMTVTVEISSTVAGLGRFCVEDLILIEEEGYQVLTDHMDTSKMFVIR
jgi:Xaa-Pro aminopeptidase